MKLIINLIIKGLAVFITAYLLPGVTVDSFITAVIVSVVLGIINIIVKPIISLFTLPINVLTLGLFSFVINGLMILLTDRFVSGFFVDGLWTAILFSLVLSGVSWFLNLISK